MNKNIGDMSESELKDFIIELQEENQKLRIQVSAIEETFLNQQKEFISYLENEKDRLIHETSHHYTDSFDRQHAVNETIYDEVDKNLSKYKEIIGGKDE